MLLSAVTEDMEQLLQVVLQAVGQWASIMEIVNKIIPKLSSDNQLPDQLDLIARKKKLGKVPPSFFFLLILKPQSQLLTPIW